MPKPAATTKENPRENDSPWRWRGAVLLIVLGVALAYANSLRAPFVFDDLRGVVKNPSIRSLWPLSEALMAPPSATGAAGRPMVNLSLAINYALGGMDVRGYHLFNLLVHALSALTLFGLVRRTLVRPVLKPVFGADALPLAFAVALLWSLHPLLTESVTGIIQRTESMGGLFYLLTLYAFVRSIEEGAGARWQTLSVFACLLGMATKEIMATVPVIVLLYDRTFVAGTLKAAWQQRRRYYGALMATWLLLCWLAFGTENRGGSAGFGLGMSSWDYALTQCRAILLYLKLSFWPHPLIVDYGSGVVSRLGDVWWQGVVLLALVAGTFVALVKKPVVGFVAFMFFAILAPSSSFVPLITQTIAEHRMYLPLACVLVLAGGGLYRMLGRRVVPALLVLALLAAVGTAQRNRDYRSEIALWEDTVSRVPGNTRARQNLGAYLSEKGRFEEAISQYEAALQLEPRNAELEYNWGNALLQLQRFPEAGEHYIRSLAINPGNAMAHYGLANSVMRQGRFEEALEHLQRATELLPTQPEILHTYASTLAYLGRGEEAWARYEEALRLTPDDPGLQGELGFLLVRLGKSSEAASHLQVAVHLAPRHLQARYALGMIYLQQQAFAAAAEQFSEIVRRQPDRAEAQRALGESLLGLKRWTEAVGAFKAALRLDPNDREAQRDLERAELLRDLRG